MNDTDNESTNTLEDLRVHLFDTLKALKDPNKPMDVSRAKAISDVAARVIDSAKVEVDYLKVTGQDGSLRVLGKSKKADVPKLPGGDSRVHKIR